MKTVINNDVDLDIWYTLTPKEIMDIEDVNTRNLFYTKYILSLNELKLTDDELKYAYNNKSIEQIHNMLLEEEYENYNNNSNIFPNYNIYFYPRIKMQKSKIKRICHFSGGIIKPGSYYYEYRPLIWNKTSKETYVLGKTITCELNYGDLLPKTITEFEQMSDKIENAFDNNDDEWYNFNCNYGNNELSLVKLRKK